VFVRKVRQKLERVSRSWSYIHTHFGVGYRFDPDQRDEPGTEQPPEALAELPVADDDSAPLLAS